MRLVFYLLSSMSRQLFMKTKNPPKKGSQKSLQLKLKTSYLNNLQISSPLQMIS
jgi:hypothetical protein